MLPPSRPRPGLRPRRLALVLILPLLVGLAPTGRAAPQEDAESSVESLETRLAALERRVDRTEERVATSGLALFVIGCLCALWAQNSGRSAWLWFFLGVFFHVFTLVAMLVKNGRDAREQRP